MGEILAQGGTTPAKKMFIYVIHICGICEIMAIDFHIAGSDMVKKTARKHGDSAHVYLPKDWADKEVVVILVEKENIKGAKG